MEGDSSGQEEGRTGKGPGFWWSHSWRRRAPEAGLEAAAEFTWDILSLKGLWDVQGRASSEQRESPWDLRESSFQVSGGQRPHSLGLNLNKRPGAFCQKCFLFHLAQALP